MTLGYGIQGIGWNPLGNLGLEMSGQFSSYDSYMPSMMVMNGTPYGVSYGSPYGAGGLMSAYPTFMAQMQQTQNNMELARLNHAGDMQAAILNHEVAANRNSDSALMNKMLTNGHIKQGIQNLHKMVITGNQDGICKEFDRLRANIYNTYKDEFKARGDKINAAAVATEYIESLYANIVTAQYGGQEIHDLRSDIERYGDSAVMNGFMQGFRSDHHSRYVDETLNHCFGLEIDRKGSKDFGQTFGKGVGGIASILEKGVYGAAVGVGLWTLGNGVGKALGTIVPKQMFGRPTPTLITFKNWAKRIPAVAGIGLALGMVADAIWKLSNDNEDKV